MEEWTIQDWKTALVARGSDEEQQAYEMLAKYLIPNARKYLHVFSSADLADDFVQTTLLKVYEKYNKFQWRSHIKTYAVSILHNEIKQHFRSPKFKKEEQVTFQDSDSDEENDPFNYFVINQSQDNTNPNEHLLEQKELRTSMYNAINTLSELQKTIIIEYYINEKQVFEITEMLSLTTNALHQNLSRARKILNTYFNDIKS